MRRAASVTAVVCQNYPELAAGPGRVFPRADWGRPERARKPLPVGGIIALQGKRRGKGRANPRACAPRRGSPPHTASPCSVRSWGSERRRPAGSDNPTRIVTPSATCPEPAEGAEGSLSSRLSAAASSAPFFRALVVSRNQVYSGEGADNVIQSASWCAPSNGEDHCERKDNDRCSQPARVQETAFR